MGAQTQQRVLCSKNKRTDEVLEKLETRAEKVGFGSIVCELKIHHGEISQIDITSIREKVRGDVDE